MIISQVVVFMFSVSMENMQSYWQLGDELRGQSIVSEDQQWYAAASRLAEQTRSKGERRNNLDMSKVSVDGAHVDLRSRCSYSYELGGNIFQL
ncbi:putative DCD domain-containing protein NRP [Helianthus debilis subsp. tardiflorus]